MNRRTVPVPSLPPTPVRSTLAGHVHGVVSRIRGLAFWGAVVLPLAYVPLLSTPVDDRQLLALAGLVAMNVCCLLVGHDYSP